MLQVLPTATTRSRSPALRRRRDWAVLLGLARRQTLCRVLLFRGLQRTVTPLTDLKLSLRSVTSYLAGLLDTRNLFIT